MSLSAVVPTERLRSCSYTRRMHIRRYLDRDTSSVVALWEAAALLHPDNDPFADIDRKMADSPWGFIAMVDRDDRIGTVMVGYDGHRGWINELGCHPDHRRRGAATALMAEAQRLLAERGCPKTDLQVRAGNEPAQCCYERLGDSNDDVTSFGLRLEHDN